MNAFRGLVFLVVFAMTLFVGKLAAAAPFADAFGKGGYYTGNSVLHSFSNSVIDIPKRASRGAAGVRAYDGADCPTPDGFDC